MQGLYTPLAAVWMVFASTASGNLLYDERVSGDLYSILEPKVELTKVTL